MTVIGIDACARGWVGVVLDDTATGATFVAAVSATRFADVVGLAPGASVVAVDMPVGMCATGVRSADLAARAALGRRYATVFLTPTVSALAAGGYEQASAANREVTGQSLSRQAWALAGKIAEVEEWRLGTGRTPMEVHPELAFARLAGAPLPESKKTWTGMVRRRALLRQDGIGVPDDVGPAGRWAAVDDLLDAAAVAGTALRIRRGEARPLPDPPDLDHLGRPMAIWV